VLIFLSIVTEEGSLIRLIKEFILFLAHRFFKIATTLLMFVILFFNSSVDIIYMFIFLAIIYNNINNLFIYI
jgi:hypothetical protein